MVTAVRKSVSDLVNNEAKEYSFYVVVNRAIPSLIDGLKSSQRFVLYSTIENASTKKKKIASLAGVISEYGYNHAETAAYEAMGIMANDWNNNYPILEGEGNFGSRAVNDAAAPRYIFCKLSNNFHNLFKDGDLVPEHEIKSFLIPKFYLPVIPFILVNGTSGIAVGYSTDILPHDIFSIINSCRNYVKTGKNENAVVKFPKFIGDVVTDGVDGWYIEGKYELQSKTKMVITEIPLKYDRVKYVSLLNKLRSNDTIVGYEEIDGDGDFTFRVTLKRDFDSSHSNIVDVFGLKQSISQNLVAIGPNSDMINRVMDVRKYNETKELIADFVDYRMTYVDKRIENMIDILSKKIPELKAKVDFIKLSRDGKIKFKDNTKKQIIEQIESHFDDDTKPFAGVVVGMPIYNMSDDEIKRLEKEYIDTIKELDYWKTTNSKKEYLKDLNTLEENLKKELRGKNA